MSLKEDAAEKLQVAYADALSCESVPDCSHKDFIDFVIDNTHLTFKYILFTGILSKATDPTINALCLQAGSSLPGAYDARTVCHKVIVPFEMETLEKALGGSNEPFLNKPARFPELSKTDVLLPVKDVPDRSWVPLIRIVQVGMTAVLRMMLHLIGRWVHDAVCFECFFDSRYCFAIRSHLKDTLHNDSCFGIHIQGLLVIRPAGVAIRDTAAASLAILHPGTEDCPDLVAGILGIPFVHDIQEGSEVILHRIGAVHIVVDCNEAHTLVGEHDLSVETNLKVVSSKAAHVLHDDGRDVTGLDFLQHFVECRTIER